MGRGAAGGDGPRPRRKGACGAEGGREKRYPRPRPPPAARYAVRGRLRGDAVASPGTAAADARRRRSERPAVGAEVKIGRASCRERVCQDVEILVVAGSFKTKKQKVGKKN